MSTVAQPYNRRPLPSNYDPGFFSVEFSNILRAIAGAEGDTGLVNLKSLGGIVNGTADATAILAQAAAHVPAGGTILIPGFARTSATVTINTPDVTVMSWGTWGGIVPANASFNPITLGPLAHRAKIMNMWVKGAAVDDTTAQYGIWTNGGAAPDDVEIAGVLFGDPLIGSTASLNSAIKIDGGNGWNVHDCKVKYLQGNTSNHGYGILAGTTNKLHAHDNEFLGTTGRGRHGVYLSGGCTYCDVHDNHVEGMNEDGIPIYSQGSQAFNIGNHIHSNTILNCGQLTAESGGVAVDGRSSRNVVEDNIIINFQGYGIIIDSVGVPATTDRNVVRNNWIYQAQWNGILNYGAQGTRIRNNHIFDAAQASPGSYGAISIRTQGAVVSSGVIVKGNEATGSSLRAGLEIGAGQTGLRVVDNYFPDGQVAKIDNPAAVVFYGQNNDFGIPAIGGDNGDTSQSHSVFDSETYLYATNLTANRTATILTTNMWEGCRRVVLRTGLGAGTLNVGPGLKTIPAATAASVEVEMNAAGVLVLVNYSPL